MSSTNGIPKFSIHKTPIAVIAFETTGLMLELDQIVDVSVYRLKPRKTSYLAFDTMFNPQRPMFTTGIYLSNLENSMNVCPNLAGQREKAALKGSNEAWNVADDASNAVFEA